MEEEIQSVKPENINTARRWFLKTITLTIGTIAGLVLGIPFIGALIGRSNLIRKVAMARVTNLGKLPLGQPERVNFLWQKEDAYVHETTVRSIWTIEHSASDVTVFSPICPHAGCYYNWDRQSNQFHCPCHGSVFSITGKVLGGPAPRPLDTLPHDIKGGELYVTWEEFKSGVPEKIRIS